MNKTIILIFTLCYIFNCNAQDKSSIKTATFNIRYDNPDDGPNNWLYRKQHVFEFIKKHKLSVIGFQEVLDNQLQDMKDNLVEYSFIGVGRDDGKSEGEYAPIAYLKDSFVLLDENTFWLSEHPNDIGKKGWDAACTRIATWIKLKDNKNGKVFMVVNTHFDHVGTVARKNSALLIIDKIKEIVGEKPAIITGDFNVTDQSEAYKTITTNSFVLKDAHKIAPKVSGMEYTFHNFGKTSEDTDGGKKIDFIFVTPQIEVVKSEIPSAKIDSILYLTDHNPQIVTLKF